jgi:hypothetical protein
MVILMVITAMIIITDTIMGIITFIITVIFMSTVPATGRG